MFKYLRSIYIWNIYLNIMVISAICSGDQSKMASFIGGIINITIGAVVLAAVFISTIKTTNTSTWSASEVAMWGLLSLVGIVGLLYGVLQVFGLA